MLRVYFLSSDDDVMEQMQVLHFSNFTASEVATARRSKSVSYQAHHDLESILRVIGFAILYKCPTGEHPHRIMDIVRRRFSRGYLGYFPESGWMRELCLKLTVMISAQINCSWPGQKEKKLEYITHNAIQNVLEASMGDTC
jgi:hypothetical protein